MIKRFSSMWRLGLALVMVLTLGLVMAAPVSANVSTATVTNAPQTVGTAATYTVAFTTTQFLLGGSTIVITFPVDTTVPPGPIAGSTVKVNDTACTTVTGVGQALNITVPQDTPPGPVTVVIDKAAGVTNPTTVGATWKLTVKTSAEITPIDSAAYSTVVPVPPTLTVDITLPPDGATVSVGQTFTVTAVVINTGGGTATDVTATMAITGSASTADPLTKDVTATLLVGGSATATWTATCNAPGAVTIKVTPAGKYLVGGVSTTIPSANLIFDQIGLTQQAVAALTVTAVTVPSTVKVGETFTATATVKNTGGAKATDVTATISITGPATATAPLTKPAPPTTLSIGAGATSDLTWTVTCTAVGDAGIKVTAAGKDANSGAAIADATGKTATVTQTMAAVLEVTISTPSDGEVYAVGDPITVTAAVENTGASTAKDVTLTLTIDARAALKTGQVTTQTVGYLAPGDTSSDVTWELVCTAAGKSKITVSPSGKDVLTGSAIPAGSLKADSVTVLQSVITYDITLVKGWNLISLPLIPTDPSIGTVLAGVSTNVKVNKVAYYTGGPAGSWQYYNPSPAPSDLYLMKDGKGYWIDVIDVGAGPLTLTVTGVALALPGQLPPTYDLVVGWNLIGFTSISDKTPTAYLGSDVILALKAIYGYDATTKSYFIPGAVPNLQAGYGYWLAVNASGKIYP